jgi:hypothetical protein
MVEKAASAALKACNIYALPLFDYDLACYLGLAGEGAEANSLFAKFLSAQAAFKPNQFDQMFLRGRDIRAAVEYAHNRVAQP